MAIASWTLAFEATPAGSDPGSVIDDRINEFKEQVGRRWEQGGQILSDDPRGAHTSNSHSDRDGRHVVDAGGAGISPHIYKSPTTDADIDTELVKYTDALITIDTSVTLTGGASDMILPNDLTVANDVTVQNDLTVDVNTTLTGTTTMVGAVTMPVNTVHQSVQDSVATQHIMTPAATWIQLSDSVVITTRAVAAGNVLIIWSGCIFLEHDNTNDDTQFDFRIRRNGGVIKTFTEKLRHDSNSFQRIRATLPVTLTWLDTGAVAATATTYDIQAQRVDNVGTPLLAEIKPNERSLIVVELKNDF